MPNKFYRNTLMRYGVAPGLDHEKLLRSIDFNTILDIGANKGQFALVGHHIHKNVKIISFEPLSKPAGIFKKIFDPKKNVKLFNAAIGPVKQIALMHVSKRIDSSSLLPIGKNQATLFPGTAESHEEEIFVAPLAHFIALNDLIRPVFVKIDVQGFELEVIRGCKELINEFDYIYVECSFIELYKGQALANEVIKELGKYKFRLNGIYNLIYDLSGVAIQGDFLFKKEF